MTTPSYYVTIDSEFRDDQKYPFPTDFSVKFKDDTTGTQVLGVPSTGTSGSLADAFTTTLQIDPDYYSSRIRVVNGTILNVKQVQQGPTNPVVFLVCGIMKHPLNEYVDFELYEGDNKLVSIGFGCPQAYLVQLTVVNGALDAFWICYTKSQSQTNECNRCSFDLYFSDILSLTTVYFLFEFTDTVDLLVGVPGTAQTNFVITNPTNNNICLGLVALNLVGILYTINGHSWGYHIYSSNQDLTNTEANGRSNVNIDTALNLYISANVNPYNPTINYVNEINENIGPIQINNIWGTTYTYNSDTYMTYVHYAVTDPLPFGGSELYVDIFSTSSTGMSRVYQNIVTTTPAFYGYPLYPVFPILGTNSFFATYNNIGYLITASVGDFTSPTLNRDFVLSTLDYSTNIFTWSAESGASAGTDDNYKYSNSILYNYYMICVTYDYVSESPFGTYNFNLRFYYIDLTNTSGGFNFLYMLPTTFTFSEPPSALQPNRLIKPSLFFDGSILYVTFADILSKLYIIKIAINDNIMTSSNSINWTTQTPSVNNNWTSICWSPELNLFVAVSNSGVGNRVMTSLNGITWISRTSASDNDWTSVCWSPDLNLFAAVSNSGVGDRVMTSLNGITWTTQTSAADNDWTSVCWSPELDLFVAVSNSGVGDRVMTSPNGITWTTQTSAADNDWSSVCWSPELDLFVAVSTNGTGDRVMTSPDGIVWTTQTSAADNNWTSVCWSPDLNLFVAVSNSGVGDRVMTSPNGITWITRASASDNDWTSVCWSPQLSLFVAVSNSGVGDRVMTSYDGVNWVSRISASDKNWTSVCWSPQLNLFAAVSGGIFDILELQRVITENYSTLSNIPLTQVFKKGVNLYTLMGFENGSSTVLLDITALNNITLVQYLNSLYNPCQIYVQNESYFVIDSFKTIYNIDNIANPILVSSNYPLFQNLYTTSKNLITDTGYMYGFKETSISGNFNALPYNVPFILQPVTISSEHYNRTVTYTFNNGYLNPIAAIDMVNLPNQIFILEEDTVLMSLRGSSLILEDITNINDVEFITGFLAINQPGNPNSINGTSFTIGNVASFKVIKHNDFIYVFIGFKKTAFDSTSYLAVTKLSTSFGLSFVTTFSVVVATGGGSESFGFRDMSIYTFQDELFCCVLTKDAFKKYRINDNNTITTLTNTALTNPFASPPPGNEQLSVSLKTYVYPNSTVWAFVIWIQRDLTNYLINSSILYPIEINDDNTITEYTANKVEGIFGGHANSASIFKYPDNTVKLLTRNLGQTTIAVFDVTFPQSIGIISCPGWNYSPNYTADSSWNYNRNLGPLSVIQNPVTTKIYGFQTQTPAGSTSVDGPFFTNYFAFRDYTNLSNVPGSNFIPIDVPNQNTPSPTGARCVDIRTITNGQKIYAALLISNSSGQNGYAYQLYDVTNPDFAATYYSPTANFLSFGTTYTLNPSIGMGFINKLDALANNQWLSHIGGDLTTIIPLNVNISNVAINSSLSSLYVTGGWRNKIENFNPNGSKVNKIVSPEQNYNGFLSKVDLTTNGSFVWLMPSYGTANINFERLNYISSKDQISFVTNFSTPILLLNDIQTSSAGPFTNPITSQLNLSNTSISSSALITITPAGKVVYSCKLYSSAQSIFVNLYDLAIDETSSIKTIKVVGTTNASQVFSIDSSNTSNQIIYTNFIDSASQTVVIIYTYDLSGIYQSSHQIEFPPNVNVSVQDIKSFSSFNRFSIFPNFLPRDTDANIFIYNKDGTLATGTNTYTNDTYNSIVIEYIYNPTYTDVNGVSYSKIVLQKSFNYVPESLVNYYLFIQGNLNNPYEISTIIADNTVLNKNFSIRHNFIENSKDVIILNQLIDVKNIIRKDLSSDQFFGTNWAGNISPSELPAIISYNNSVVPLPDDIVITGLYGLTSINTSATGYYLMYPTNTNTIKYVPINYITFSNGTYTMNITNAAQELDDITPIYDPYYGPFIYLTETNKNAYYTLQFSPGTIYDKIYYNLKLNSLVIPNRRITSSYLPGTRSINDFRYIYLEVYNENDQGQFDTGIANNYFTNNQNFVAINQRTKTLFEIPMAGVSVNSDTNFVVLSNTSNIPILVISPGYYNLHIRLVDMYGNIINFDSTPNSAKASDSIFSGNVVDTSLMQMAANFTFTKINK